MLQGVLADSEGLMMDEKRLAKLEAEHSGDHYEEDSVCVVLDLIAEVRRLQACTCGHVYPCPSWAGYRQVAWKS